MKALIVFARYPEPGKVKTRLGKEIGMEAAATIYRTFALHAFSIADKLRTDGIGVYLFHPPDVSTTVMQEWVNFPFHFATQQGADLGERMLNAFRTVFGDGADSAVIIGTDVPELEPETVRAGFSALVDHDAAIGPCPDGGYYLLGLRELQPRLFSGIEWSTEHVLSRTLGRLDALGLSRAVLPPRQDIDTGADYDAYRSRTGA